MSNSARVADGKLRNEIATDCNVRRDQKGEELVMSPYE